MAHAQEPDFVFPWNGQVHLNRWGRQFSRILAAEVCASACAMLDRPWSGVVWEYWLPTPFASFPFTSPPVRHRMPPGSERALSRMLSTLASSFTQHMKHTTIHWKLNKTWNIKSSTVTHTSDKLEARKLTLDATTLWSSESVDPCAYTN